ncbi:hypothetical protein bcere0025_27720 [Bacillus cereus F65185]|nr:hypothetical protein bcere0025_27720 [Bacillus cereus F65185]
MEKYDIKHSTFYRLAKQYEEVKRGQPVVRVFAPIRIMR